MNYVMFVVGFGRMETVVGGATQRHNCCIAACRTAQVRYGRY